MFCHFNNTHFSSVKLEPYESSVSPPITPDDVLYIVDKHDGSHAHMIEYEYSLTINYSDYIEKLFITFRDESEVKKSKIQQTRSFEKKTIGHR